MYKYIQRRYEIYRENHGKLKSQTESWRRKLNGRENLLKNLLRGCTITITIYDSDDATHILWKCTGGYKLTKSQEKIYHLMYVDNTKLFAKNKKQLESLIETLRTYSQDIGMESCIEKCTMLLMRSGKQYMMEGIE